MKPLNSANRLDVRSPKNGAAILRRTPRSVLIRRVLELLIVIPGLCAAGSAYAAQDGTTLFREGQSAFEKQDYCGALRAFEAAIASGRAGPAVQFNIGVAAYRCGEFRRAQTAFAEVARTPAMASLAHYNLGLVSLAQGRADEARNWFAHVERESTDERLRSLASAQLAGLPAPQPRDWIVYGVASAGYDDNVALISSSDIIGISGTEDAFAEAQLAVTAPDIGPWRFDASGFLVTYVDLDEFDQFGAQAGGRYVFDAGRWSNEGGLRLGYTTLDGSDFEQATSLSLQTATFIVESWKLRARYRFIDTNGLGAFDGLTGSRHEMSAFIESHSANRSIEFGYRFDNSDYRDSALSAVRHQLTFETHRLFTQDWSGGFGAAWRLTNYDSEDAGEERRLELTLEASRPLSSRWYLVLRYAYADNRADQPEYNYDRSRVTAGVEAIW